MRISLSRGKLNVSASESSFNSLSELIQLLRAHTGVEAWWSASLWEGSSRGSGAAWRAAGVVAVDVDYEPGGVHSALTAEALEAVQFLAATGGLPASAWHPTPRGVRLLRLMESETMDVAVYTASAERACEDIAAALRGVAGLKVDVPASTDRKRLLWTPRATVDGVTRTADVAVLRVAPWPWTAPKAAPRAEVVRAPTPRATRESGGFDEAAARYRVERGGQRFEGHSGECPICQHRGCFGALAGSGGAKWHCFSSGHPTNGVGAGQPMPDGGGRWGDVLDLDAALAGRTLAQHLVAEGFLAERRPTMVSAPRVRASRAEHLTRMDALPEPSGALAAEREPGCDDDAPALAPTAAPVVRWAPKVIRGGSGSGSADAEPIPFDAPAVTVGDVGGDDFELRARGLRWPGSAWRVQDGGRVERKSAGMDAPATVSTAPIYVAGRSRDILTGEVVLVVRWRGAGGWQELAIPRGEALDGRGIVKYAGQDLPVSSVSAKELVRWLAEFEAANLGALPTGRVSSALGWVGRGTDGGYLWGAERIGGAGEPVRFRGPDAGEAQHADSMHRAGTLEGWQRAIAPMLALPASMALWAVFAAPLLPLLGRTGCTVHLSGGGQGTGKSAACYAAMSAVGQPRAVSMGWRGTAVSHERRLALCGGGMPLYFDDARECHPQEVLAVLMSVTNGRGKGRGSVSGTRADATWKTMLLSTGEEPATASATHGGEVARTIEVTELPWGTKGTIEGARLVREVTRGTQENYGHALPEFVRRVTAKYTADDLRAAWRALVAELSDAVKPEEGDFGYRLAEHRAVLLLASKLAYELGIVTARPVAMSWASSEVREGERSEEERARARIASWVASEAVRFVGSEAHTKAPAGSGAVWGRWSEVDGTVAIISEVLRERLREWKFSPDIAIEGAARRGWLKAGDGKNLTRKEPIEGRNRPRCYVWRLSELFD